MRKKTGILYVAIIALAGAMLAVSCAGINGIIEPVVGTWGLDSVGGVPPLLASTMTFDGSYGWTRTQLAATDIGTWSKNGSTYTATVTDTQAIHIYSLSDDHASLIATDGIITSIYKKL